MNLEKQLEVIDNATEKIKELSERLKKQINDNAELRATILELNDKIKELSEKQKWIPCSERMPNVEEKVLAKCIRKYIDGTTKTIITTAMYEDGNFLDCYSMWNWEEIDWAGWDDENDCGIIPEGWYEYHEYNPDGVINYAIDDEVVAWMELHEPYQSDENKIDENRVCAAKQMGFLK